jgi:hypothetical protein
MIMKMKRCLSDNSFTILTIIVLYMYNSVSDSIICLFDSVINLWLFSLDYRSHEDLSSGE